MFCHVGWGIEAWIAATGGIEGKCVVRQCVEVNVERRGNRVRRRYRIGRGPNLGPVSWPVCGPVLVPVWGPDWGGRALATLALLVVAFTSSIGDVEARKKPARAAEQRATPEVQASARRRARVTRATNRGTAPAPAVAAVPAARTAPSAVEPVLPSGQAGVQPAAIATPAVVTRAAMTIPAQPLAATTSAAAGRVLDRHCAGCHQAGRTEAGAPPAGNFANVLDLDALARNGALISPGDADASPLYQLMVARQMPPDPRARTGHGPAAAAPEPTGAPTAATDATVSSSPPVAAGSPATAANAASPAASQYALPPLVEVGAAELEAVRAWIDDLPRDAGACQRRPHISAQAIAATIDAWTAEIGGERAAGLRFVSLAALSNGCASDAEMAAARQGVVKLLNSLSWLAAPVEVETVGDDLALLAFRLRDAGWSAEHWELLLSRLPVASRIAVPADAGARLGTPHPVVPATWLAATAADPAVYSQLLGLPASLDALAGVAGVALDDARESGSVRRGAMRVSGETGAVRFIDFYAARRGAFWVAHDRARRDGEPLDEPLTGWLAPPAAVDTDANGGAVADDSAMSRVLMELPNGSTAFAAYRDGASAGLSTGAVAGLRCLSCHASGPRGYTDELAQHVASPGYAGSDLGRDLVRQSLAGAGETARLVTGHSVRHGEALARAGVAPDVTLDGLEPVTALIARHERDADLAAAAADMLITRADLDAGLNEVAGEARALALRLQHRGRLTRGELEQLKAALTRKEATQAAAVTAATASSKAVSRLRLDLWPVDDLPRGTDALVRLAVRASAPCHVTIVNIDAGHKATVLFPNEFDRDNLLAAGLTKVIPGNGASYRFRLAPGASERFVAICEEGEPVPAGVTPDFTKQNFTPLGDWPAFIASAHKAAGAPRVPLENGDDPDRRFRRGRKSEPASRPAPAVTPRQGRAAISVSAMP